MLILIFYWFYLNYFFLYNLLKFYWNLLIGNQIYVIWKNPERSLETRLERQETWSLFFGLTKKSPSDSRHTIRHFPHLPVPYISLQCYPYSVSHFIFPPHCGSPGLLLFPWDNHSVTLFSHLSFPSFIISPRI